MEAKNRRAWIKNVAIIFLVILLLLTFFSNTILNYSLPEVSAQYARYDSIAGAVKVSGTVKANESFSVVYDEAEEGSVSPGQTRKILSVYVKAGSEVAIGDPILALQGGASKELEEAEIKLRELEKQYALDQHSDTISALTSDKSQTESRNNLNKAYRELADLRELYAALQAGTDPTETLKAQKKAAQKEAESIQKQIDTINSKISETKSAIAQGQGMIEADYISGKTLEERHSEARVRYETLQNTYDTLTGRVEILEAEWEEASEVSADMEEAYTLSQQINTLSDTLNDLQKQLSRLREDSIIGTYQEKKAARDSAKAELEAYEAEYGAEGEEWSFLSAQLTVAEKELEESESAYNAMLENGAYGDLDFSRQEEDLLEQITETKEQIAQAHAKLNILGQPYISDLSYYRGSGAAELEEELNDTRDEWNTVKAEYEAAKAEYESLSRQMSGAGIVNDNEVLLAVFEKDLETYQELLEEVNETIAGIEEDLQDASARNKDPEEVKEQIDELSTSISNMEMQLKIDQATEQKSDTEASYTRTDQVKEIEELKADIEAMKNAPDETVVTAPIAGKISEIHFVPGNSITSGTEVTRIEVADQGYVCEVSIAAEEARKIQVGAECSIVNSWWYSNVDATVTQIRSDPQSQGKNRIVVISVQGDDVQEGQSLNFSIGDKSQSYDTVLPNSAIREDSEGKFVLVVESKNTPLSVRYTARRMNIEIIASDDTKSAVSGLYGSEFVITSTTSPISDGQQVRLAET